MWKGTVVNIFIAPESGAPMQAIEAVRAVPDRGLEGDRYFDGVGSLSRWPGGHREVTLIAEEALEAMEREAGIALSAEASRRNVLVRGVPLNELVGQTFRVGPVTLKGIRLCQPCKYLVRLTGEPGLLPGMVDRGGLRAHIVHEGVLRVGDAVRPDEEDGG